MSLSFRLENVLRFRKFLEQTAQKELLQAQAARMRQEKAVESLRIRRAESVRECRQACLDGVPAGRYRLFLSTIEAVDARLARARDALEQKKNVVKQKQSALDQARIDKKTLETLRDREQERCRAASEKAERNRLDEVALTRFGRRS